MPSGSPHVHTFDRLLDVLKEKKCFQYYSEFARLVGCSPPRINQARTNSPEASKELIQRSVEAYERHLAENLIVPILQFEPIDPHRSSPTSWNFYADRSKRANLRSKLRDRKGIYCFHDSSGRTIYSGLAGKPGGDGDLYTEAKQRLLAELNRSLYLPNKQPEPALVGQIAKFLTAYEITSTHVIEHIEGMLLACFGNDLWNKNGTRF